MTTLTPKEILKLSKYSKAKAGSRYQLSDNVFADNASGHGATKAHTEIGVKGFVTTLPIARVMQLMEHPVLDESKVDDILAAIGEGRGVAAPRVFLEIDNYMSFSKGRCKVADYDGYNICMALTRLGVKEVPVQFPLLGYTMRNIENKNEFFNKIAEGVETPAGAVFKDLINKTTT